MASLVRLKNGLRQIKWSMGQRDCRLRLGRASEQECKAALRHVTELLDCRDQGHAPHPTTKRWLEQLPDDQHARLAGFGLVRSRKETNVLWLDGFLAWCRQWKLDSGCSPTSLQVYDKVAANLREHFGGRLLESITRQDVDAFQDYLLTRANKRTGRGLASATANKRLKVGKEWFEQARDRGWIEMNPFAHLRGLESESAGPINRKHFVPRKTMAQLLANAPDTEWRLLLTLWRYAGLRQLEPFELRWADISWETGRMTVTAKKQRSERKRRRVIPIWPEVLPHLRAQFDEAPEGTDHVIWRRRYAYDTAPERRSTGSALHSRLERQCLQLGIPTWPRLTHNLRASGETELEQSGRFSAWVIAYWWNHSVKVQQDHYLQVTDEVYQAATERASTGAPSEIGRRTINAHHQ